MARKHARTVRTSCAKRDWSSKSFLVSPTRPAAASKWRQWTNGSGCRCGFYTPTGHWPYRWLGTVSAKAIGYF